MVDAARPAILVIDASDFFRRAIRESLTAAGHVCRTAPDLEAGADDLADPAVGLVILDLEGAGSNADRAIRSLRSEGAPTRAIVISCHGEQDRVLAALRAGASDYLAKPLHEQELLLSVERALSGWRADREISELRTRVGAEARASEADLDLDLARDLCEAVVASGDPADLPETLLARVAERVSAVGAALYRVEPGQGSFVREAVWKAGSLVDRPWLPAGRGLSGAAASTGVFVACPDPAADPRFDAEVDRPEEGAPGAFLCLPLHFRHRTVGLVRLFLAEGTEPSLRTAEVATAALSAALRSVLLYRSLRSSIDEVARIRRESAARPVRPRPGASPRPRTG